MPWLYLLAEDNADAGRGVGGFYEGKDFGLEGEELFGGEGADVV